MDTKKNEARFTIKFNPVNPRHREAMRILNESGRGKAALIADALCMYVHYGADMKADLMRGNVNAMAPGSAQDINVCKTGNADLANDALLDALVDSVDSFFN